MPNGWGFNFSEEARMTNSEFSAELAKLTPMTAKEIQNLFPRKIDKQKMMTLIEIVNSSASKDRKRSELRSIFEEVDDIVLKLLTKFLKSM